MTRVVFWARVAVAAGFASLVPFWLARPRAGGDTPWLLDGTEVLRGCLARGDLVGCGFSPSAEVTAFGGQNPIGPWPLLQYLVDLPATTLGLNGHSGRVRLLALLSVLAVIASVLLARIVLTRASRAGWFWGFALVVLGGPVVAYANTAWGEMLATGLLVCFVSAMLLPARPALVGLAACAASLTKETVYPFIVVAGLLGLVLARRRTGAPIRRHVVWGAGGLAFGIALASLFNILRWGSVLNTNQLEPEFRTPGIGRKLEFALGLLVSPNGGTFVFWTSAAVLLLAACLLPFVARVVRSGGELDRRPALVLIAIAAVLVGGLASWWTPFGWYAWGPRLTLPWVLPLVLIALVAYGDPLAELTGRLLTSTRRLLLVAAALVALALPHIGYLAQPETLGAFFSPNDPYCSGSYGVGSERYYSCLHHQMWARHPMLLDALSGLKTTYGALTSIAVALALVGCLVLLREEFRTDGLRRSGTRTPID